MRLEHAEHDAYAIYISDRSRIRGFAPDEYIAWSRFALSCRGGPKGVDGASTRRQPR
jgi:hypothetical protein